MSKKKNQASVLIVDDDPQIRQVVEQLMKNEGHTCFTAEDGADALGILEKESVDVVITDIDMPRMDGVELTRHIKPQYDIDVIMMTGHIRNVTYQDAVTQGASDFIQKPFEPEEIILRLARLLRERQIGAELMESLKQLNAVLDGLIGSWSTAVEARDPYTSGHQKRVALLATAIAEDMQLSEAEINGIRMACTIHDLGKIAIPVAILSKPSELSDLEYGLVKNHAQIGYDILKDIQFPTPVADIVHQHHERIDGSGYPQKLKGADILLEARIVAVSDVAEAMSSHRPYRPALGIDMAIAELIGNQGLKYDRDVVESCVKIINEIPGLLD